MVAHGVLDHALGTIADHARDEVDRARGCVGIEHRRRSASHHLDPLDRLVETERLIAIEEAQGGVVLYRHSIFQQGHRSKSVHRDAARTDVAARLAAGCFHPESRHGFHRLGHRGRGLQSQTVFIDASDRVAGFGLAALGGAGTTGYHHRVQFHRVRRRGFLCIGVVGLLRVRERAGAGGKRQGKVNGASKHVVVLIHLETLDWIAEGIDACTTHARRWIGIDNIHGVRRCLNIYYVSPVITYRLRIRKIVSANHSSSAAARRFRATDAYRPTKTAITPGREAAPAWLPAFAPDCCYRLTSGFSCRWSLG